MRAVRSGADVARLVLRASAASAQIPRSAMIAVIATYKASVLRYIDAALDSTLGFRATSGVRAVAEQIAHAAGGRSIGSRGPWDGPCRFSGSGGKPFPRTRRSGAIPVCAPRAR
jgi:hypothetical protein